MPGLILTEGSQKDQAFYLPPDGVVAVGAREDCPVRILEGGVAPLACVIHASGGRYAVLDKTGGGVDVNGTRLEKKILAEGDTLHLGTSALVFRELLDDWLMGRNLGGYRIDARLSRDAVGTLYKATQLSVERTVAVKVLTPHLARDRTFVVEFLREARAAGRLNHPNLVQVHDVAQEEKYLFYSVEYLPGGSLKQLLERRGRLPWEEALELLKEALSALHYAEEHGVAHGDLKPSNLLLTQDRRVKVVGVGISSAHRRTQSTAQRLSPAALPYLAPEQVLSGKFDRRSDIYALGCTFYHVLSGRPPYSGKTAREILEAKTVRDPPPLAQVVREVPPDLTSVVEKMMARAPEQRYGSFGEVLDAVEGAEELAPEPAGIGNWLRGGRGRLVLASSAGLILLVAALVLFQDGGGAPSREPVRPAAPPSGPRARPPPPRPPPPRPPRVNAGAVREALAGMQDSFRRFIEGEMALDELREGLAATAGEYPLPEVEQKARELRELAEAHQEEETRRAVARHLAARVQPLVVEKAYRQALAALAQLPESEPIAGQISSAERSRIESLAREELARALASAGELAGTGDHSRAVALLEALAERLPDTIRAELAPRLEALRADWKRAVEAETRLGEAEIALCRTLAALDFAAADKAIAALPGDLPGKLAERKARLEREVKLVRTVWEVLLEVLAGKAASREPWPVSFDGDDPGAARPRVAESVAGRTLRLAAAAGAGEERLEADILSLSDEVLAGLLARDAAGPAGEDLVEGMALLLGHQWGPARAERWLARSPAASPQREHLRGRLGQIAAVGLELALARREAEYSGWKASAAETPPPEWEAGRDAVARLIREHRHLPHYLEHRKRLAELHVALAKEVHRSRGLAPIFHVDAARVTPAGALEVEYDFESPRELDAFRKLDPDTAVTVQNGTVRLMGELRLLQGDPFRDWIEVSLKVTEDYTPGAPNINVALWTGGSSRVTWSSKRYRDPLPAGLPEDEFFAFGLGYALREPPRDSLVVAGSGQACPMPAAVVLVGRRGARLHDGNQWDGLWCEPLRGLRGDGAVRVALHPERPVFFEWEASGVRGRLPGHRTPGLERLRQSGRRGSVTLFTNGEIVGISRLEVRGGFHAAWLEAELARRALEELRQIEPEDPFAEPAAAGAGTSPGAPPGAGAGTGPGAATGGHGETGTPGSGAPAAGEGAPRASPPAGREPRAGTAAR